MTKKPSLKTPVRLPSSAFEAVLEGISDGLGLRVICAAEGMPSRRAVQYRILNDPEFAKLYQLARELGGDWHAEEVIRAGNEATPENVQVARLRSDNARWASGRMHYKNWGDRLTAEHTGKDGGPLIVNIIKPSDGD